MYGLANRFKKKRHMQVLKVYTEDHCLSDEYNLIKKKKKKKGVINLKRDNVLH